MVLLSLAYLAYVMRVFHPAFWSSGMGDWMDPHFINALLEHWHQSFLNLRDPASPPMFFPARGALGYSHGLVLYAPFYVPLRLVLHPFLAYNLAIFAAIETGILCLYVLIRKYLHRSFGESLLLTAFFVSSQNVLGAATSIWAQRASVFLIPPILLMVFASWHRRHTRLGLVLAGFSGLLSTLLFTQDFYTAQFAVFFALCAVALGFIGVRPPRSLDVAGYWKGMRTAERLALAAAALAALWGAYVLWTGGVSTVVFGVTLRSHNWRRPAVAALAALGVFIFIALRRQTEAKVDAQAVRPWARAFATGAALGAAVFLWIYWAAYSEHPAFPEEHVRNALSARDPAGWAHPWTFLANLSAYDTARPFQMVLAAAALAWLPWFRTNTRTRLQFLGLLALSLVVLVLPVRFNDFSLWLAVFDRLPGFGVIRDPKRIIHLYELSVVLATAVLLARTVPTYRIAVAAVIGILLVAAPNRQVFLYARPNDLYDRWIAAPLDIERSCRSFFIKHASDAYRSRSDHMWTLYSIDALFVSLRYSIPTLNGYSAWAPPEWDLLNPDEEVYGERVQRWIQRNGLHRVCELDIDARTMRRAF